MCVIYAVYKGMPDDTELERGSWQNDDGAGICWLDKAKRTVRWIKGLQSKTEDVKKVIADNKIVPPYAIHFRTASIGGVDPDLTHPFPICKGVPLWQAGNAPLVLMHNGHIGDWKQWTMPMAISSKEFTPLPPWSDSRALAYAVYLKGEGILDFILGTSRAMILDADPSEGLSADDPESYFRLYGRWHHNTEHGFYQSIETSCVVRGGKARGGTGSTGAGTETTKVEVISPSADSARKMDIVPYVMGKADDDKASVWTVDELEALANQIEKEQQDAATIVGL
jgi:hypothetical protein